MSAWGVTGSPANCSGGMYFGVPMRCPSSVSWSSGVACVVLAIPKSAIETWPW